MRPDWIDQAPVGIQELIPATRIGRDVALEDESGRLNRIPNVVSGP